MGSRNAKAGDLGSLSLKHKGTIQQAGNFGWVDLGPERNRLTTAQTLPIGMHL
jgi:hypothetical protein